MRIGSAMVKVGQRGPEEMVSQLPTQGAILDTCYKLAQPGCQVGTLEMSSSVKKNTRQCLSWASWFKIMLHILLIMVFPGFQRKMQNIQINVATNFYSKVCEQMLRCASG